MSFSFLSSSDSDFYRSATGLVKSNGGFFRSAKQRWMLIESGRVLLPVGMTGSVKTYAGVNEVDRAAFQDVYGIVAELGTKIFITNASVRWAEGRRAQRRVAWLFVMDTYGVCRKYKLHFKETKWGSHVNATQTELEWSRPTDAVLPTFADERKPEAPVETGNHVGKEGKREVFDLTVDSVKYMGSKQVAWNVCTESWLTVMRDAAGNTVKSFGSWGESVKAGDKIKIKATVNKHTYYNGRAETIVNRVRPA